MSDDRASGRAGAGRDDDVLPYRDGATPPDRAERPARPVWPGTASARGDEDATARVGGSTALGTATSRTRIDPRVAARPSTRRRARLALTRVDPWSVFVLSLLISVFLGIVLLVAVTALYALLQTLGVFDSLNSFAVELNVVKSGQSLVGLGTVLGIAAIVAAVNVVLLTVLATLAAFLYNVCASLTGGIEVVLSERE